MPLNYGGDWAEPHLKKTRNWSQRLRWEDWKSIITGMTHSYMSAQECRNSSFKVKHTVRQTTKFNYIGVGFCYGLPDCCESSSVELLARMQCIACSFVLRGCSPERKSWLLILIKGASVCLFSIACCFPSGREVRSLQIQIAHLEGMSVKWCGSFTWAQIQ